MRRSFFSFIVSLALSAGVPGTGHAQIMPAGGTAAGDDTQPASARVGAVIFTDYTFQSLPKSTDAAGNAISPNSFNVTRTYLNVTGNVSHLVSYRITPDINSTKFTLAGNNMDGSYVFRLKYAFAQIALTDYTGLWTGSYIRLGVQQTPFVDYEENIYRYRFQGTVFAERDAGMSSSDAGVSFHANIPKSYGDLHVGFFNGENYNKTEVNDQKAFQARVSVRPFPMAGAFLKGIRLTAFRISDNVVKDAERNRTIGSVSLEQRWYNLGVDYLTRTDQPLPTTAAVDSDGYSFWVTPFFKEKGNGWEGLVRYDSFRPNADNTDQRQNRTIVGLAYWFPHPGGNGTAALLLDYEQVSFKNIASPRQQRVGVHAQINF